VTAAIILGLGLSAFGAFLFSLAHMTFIAYSRIALSGFLEERGTPDRQDILKRYDDIWMAYELWRIVFLIALPVYVGVAAPGLLQKPLLLFLGAVFAYVLVFDALARIITSRAKERLVVAALRARRPVLALAWPVLRVASWLARREKSEEASEENHEAGEEEIGTFLDEAEEEGELLRSVVEFGDTIVREIMTPRVDMVCIRKDATIQKLRNLIITEKYSRIPVYTNRIDNLEGMVMAKDLLAFSEREFDAAPIEPLIRPVLFVPESMKVSDLLREFQKGMQKLAIVVDEHGGVNGLVTMEDVVEEIVGEIRDEYDTEEAQITEAGPNAFLVSGGAKVEEIEDILGAELAEDDFITVSGLITHRLGRLPAKGETLAFAGGLTAEIIDVDQKRIKKVRFRKE
jgi:CBS domain containing-hemolysin-like protein